MKRTVELSELLTVSPEGLECAVTSKRSCLVTGVGYNSYYREHFFTLDLISIMRNEYTTERELTMAKAKGWMLAAALLGLFGAACWFGWIGLTNL